MRTKGNIHQKIKDGTYYNVEYGKVKKKKRRLVPLDTNKTIDVYEYMMRHFNENIGRK